MVIANFVIPVSDSQFPATSHHPGHLHRFDLIVIGMWLERLNIVVPSLANPRLPLPTGYYIPSLVEWVMFAGGIATFMLGFVIFARFFPLISIWEIQEGRKLSVPKRRSVSRVTCRIRCAATAATVGEES